MKNKKIKIAVAALSSLAVLAVGSFALLNDNSPLRQAEATNITLAQVADMVVNCTPVDISAGSTSCKFDLPPSTSIPANTRAVIGQNANGGACTQTGLVVNCVSVPVNQFGANSQVGVLDVFLDVNNNLTNTGEKVYILGTNTTSLIANGKIAYVLPKGKTAPFFRSITEVDVVLTNLALSGDDTITDSEYTCKFEGRSLAPESDTTSAWATIADNVPYINATGCKGVISKAFRLSKLNWQTRVSIIKGSTTYQLTDDYFYRFEGAGVAAGG